MWPMYRCDTGMTLLILTTLADNTNAALDYYLRKNFYKTASLMGHSCLAAAVLGKYSHGCSLDALTYRSIMLAVFISHRHSVFPYSMLIIFRQQLLVYRRSQWGKSEGSIPIRHICGSGVSVNRWRSRFRRYHSTEKLLSYRKYSTLIIYLNQATCLISYPSLWQAQPLPSARPPLQTWNLDWQQHPLYLQLKNFLNSPLW